MDAQTSRIHPEVPEPDERLLRGEAGWLAFDHRAMVGTHRTFVCSEPDGDRLRVRYFLRESDGAFIGRMWFGPGAEGPPGHAHGGSIAAVFDEAMGFAAWAQGHTVVAARLIVDFRSMLPLGTVTTMETSIHEMQHRKVTTRGRLLDSDGKPVAEGEGLYLKMPAKHFGDLVERFEQAMPARWRRLRSGHSR
ncbi:MAG: PaaI family thioesterase [bacterium]|nr:PaaI family thioesterase [bacterium]